MRLPSAYALSFPLLASAITLDCEHIVVDKKKFDLSKLGGPHSVHWIQETPPSISNTTFTIDLCHPLKKSKEESHNECPTGTRVCGIERDYNPEEGTNSTRRVIPIAGDYTLKNSRPLDPYWTRLKHSSSNADSEREGLRLELNGGQYPFDGQGQQQKAIIEFICDASKTGLEGEATESGEDKPDGEKKDTRKRADEKDGDDKKKEDDPDAGKSLKFISYKPEGDRNVGTLRLEWRTKYACEDAKSAPGDDSGSSSHWGFFTWFIIILFLAIAAYLIFGSWLNYNRYGARGWDLLPHGDTIRDIPYLAKDFARRVVSGIQGGGSRGGYSAV